MMFGGATLDSKGAIKTVMQDMWVLDLTSIDISPQKRSTKPNQEVTTTGAVWTKVKPSGDVPAARFNYQMYKFPN